MDPEAAAEYAEIRAILHRAALRADAADRRMDRAEKRMDRADERYKLAEKRMDRADERMEKFDRQLQTTRKLVEAGMRIVVDLGRRQRELDKSLKALISSLKTGGNGRHRL